MRIAKLHCLTDGCRCPRGRLQAVPAFLCVAADGESKAADAAVFSNQIGEPIRYFERPWRAACKAAGIVNLRWHDLRHEFASRLVEKGVPLSQVRDLLGHASIVTTERYDNQKPEALMAAAKRLETGETFNNPSSSDTDAASENPNQHADADDNSLTELEKGLGWMTGFEPAGASVACDARLRTISEPNSPKANWGG
jgi:integrase-like protein